MSRIGAAPGAGVSVSSALQVVLARRVAVAAWRLMRADRIEADLFQERHLPGGGLALALIRDGNGTRSFETLLRYRGAALAEFWRALRTLKALQAEQAVATAPVLEAHPKRRAARPPLARRPQPDEPEPGAESRPEHALPEPTARGRALHEPVAPWLPNGPDGRTRAEGSAARRATPGVQTLPSGRIWPPSTTIVVPVT